jgi:autotransporter-associated beta strand protein
MAMRITQSYWSSLLHCKIRRIVPSPLRLRAPAYILAAVLLPFLVSAASTFAGSATWNLNPTNGDWFTASNWTPATVPNGPNDMATFGVSNVTGISTSFYTTPPEVNGIVFDPGASAYSITVISFSPMTISGAGITNNSGSIQNFNAGAGFPSDGAISFTNNATAGSLTTFNNSASTSDSGGDARTTFSGASSAGSGTFTNNGGDGKCSSSGAFTSFSDTSTAANGTFINNGGRFDGIGAFTSFSDTARAGNAVLIANVGEGGGGTILFTGDSTGDTARVEVFGNGNGDFTNGFLDISGHNAPGVTVGSIEGNGNVFLGANNLTVGSNHLSTTFSGVIDGIGGSLTKIGGGTLMLSSANTYTGGTTVEGGKLIVSNRSGSGTGSGAVRVNKGTLRGRGTIAGAVTLGTGSGPGGKTVPRGRQDPASHSQHPEHTDFQLRRHL